MRLAELAEALGARLEGGDPAAAVTRVEALSQAATGELAACIARRYVAALAGTRATAVLVTPELAAHVPPGIARLVTQGPPREAFTRALRLLNAPPPLALPPAAVDPRAVVDTTAWLGLGARIGPFAVVGAHAIVEPGAVVGAFAFVGPGARIGPRTVLHPHAGVMDHCSVGADCLLGPGAVVGSVGFGLDARGRLPHTGRVVIEDAVTLGAHTCVDRATLGETRIERGAHLDNLVQVGHNARVGAGAVLCGQVGLAGGAVVEAGAVLGGQAGVAGHAVVGRGARVAAQSGVTRTLAPGGDYSGHPAEPNRRRLRRLVTLRRLADRP